MKSGPKLLSPEERRDLDGIGDRVARFRRLRHLTQTELARRIGMRPGPVNGIERGRNRPSLAVAVRLAKILDVPLDALLSNAPLPYVRETADTPYAVHSECPARYRLTVPLPDFTANTASPAAQLIRLVPSNPAYPRAVLNMLE